MSNILINRYLRIQRLRQIAMEDKNIQKKVQADLLLKQLTTKLNYLTHFTYEKA
jgi:hypothetical protein